MRKIIAGAVASAAILTSGAAHAVTGTGSAIATILDALQITEVLAIDFGQITHDGTAGSVTMEVDDGSTVFAGGVSSVTNAARGHIKVQGSANSDFTVTSQAGAFTLYKNGNTGAPATEQMTATVEVEGNDGVTLSVGTGHSTDGTGAGTVLLAGELTTVANQAEGAYIGSYTISADY